MDPPSPRKNLAVPYLSSDRWEQQRQLVLQFSPDLVVDGLAQGYPKSRFLEVLSMLALKSAMRYYLPIARLAANPMDSSKSH